MPSRLALSLGFVLASLVLAPLAAANGFRLELPERYDVELFVAPGGSDSSGNGSQARPFRSLGKALEHAKDQSLAKRQSTRIRMANGTYPEQIDIRDWGAGRETLLVIEGQEPRDGAVVLEPRQTGAVPAYIWIEGKDSLVLRNLTFTGGTDHPQGGTIRTFRTHSAAPDPRQADWLVENCVFRDCPGIGAAFFHIDYATFRHCKAYNTEDRGFRYIGRFGLVEDFEIYNTNTKGKGSFHNGGFSFLAYNLIVRRMHIHDIPYGNGFRQDHAGENILVEDSIFERCEMYGAQLETCRGPVTFRNTIFRDNGEAGIKTDTGEITFVDCEITGSPTGVVFQTGERYNPANCVPPGFGCIGSKMDMSGNFTNELPLWGVERVNFLNTTIVATGPDAQIFKIPSEPEFYEPILTQGWVGHNNVFWAPQAKRPFPNVDGKNVSDLQAWQQLTGTDTTSVFASPSSAPAGKGATIGQPQTLTFGKPLLMTGSHPVRETVRIDAPQGVAWELVTTRDWLDVQPRKGVGPADVAVSATANDGTYRRGGYVLALAPETSWDLMVVQGADANAAPPPVATHITVNPGESSAEVTWDMPHTRGVWGYGLTYREDGGVWKGRIKTQEQRAVLPDLLPGTNYLVRVHTITDDAVSDPDKATATFTTPGYRDPCELVPNGSFDTELGTWDRKGRGADLEYVADVGAGAPGAARVKIDGEGTFQGLKHFVKAGFAEHGPGTYRATAMLLTVRGAADYRIELAYKNSTGGHSVRFIQDGIRVTDAGWTEVSGVAEVNWDSPPWQASLYIQGSGNAVDFYADDISLQKVGCGR